MTFRTFARAVALIFCLAGFARADDEWQPIPRKLPGPGIKLTDADQQTIEAALHHLEARIPALPTTSDGIDLPADIDAFAKAIRYALNNDEFYKPQDVKKATDLLAAAEKRADELSHGQHSWAQQHGILARGYHSRIDGSAQPYGLEIPADVDFSKPVPLYVWLHGRGDTATDMHFLAERQRSKGQIAPTGAIVLHPFGRQCLGFKSAGETDIFEAIDSVKCRYKIDPDRVILMGFSMGGAGAWHIGAHYADQFAAVHAGAGFVDVVRYQNLKPAQYPAWYEQKLWGAYDVPDYVRNLFNVTTLSYGGEIDPQRASGQIMREVSLAEGHEIPQIIGPKMPHRYDPASLAEIMRQMRAAEETGQNRFAKSISLQTRTLRYNQMHWVTITALHQHWEDSRIDAKVVDDQHISVTTKNVDGFSLSSPWETPTKAETITVTIDGRDVPIAQAALRNGHARFTRSSGVWSLFAGADRAPSLNKIHGLQGPIDDAFMDAFLVVVPTGTCADPRLQKWVDFELQHQKDRWQAVFRGDLRIKKDSEVTDQDIERYNLVLWGDAKANKLIARVADRLPIRWDATSIAAGSEKFDSGTHVPVLIYPNPLNGAHYVVLNSGPTFRESDDRTNSLQNPKLPDWAVLDVTNQPDIHVAGKLAAAGFFDEHWQLQAPVNR